MTRADYSTRGIQRACVHRLADASRLLRRSVVTAAAIHRARTDLKAADALLLILRPTFQPASYRHSRRTLAEVRRGLGTLRDLAVNTQELTRATQRAGLSPRSTRTAMGFWTQAHHKAARGTVFSAMADDLDAVCVQLADQSTTAAHQMIRDGLRRLYRRAASSCRCAAADPSPRLLHECRQRTQRLRYALEFANPVLSDRDQRLRHRTKLLGSRLGHHRDLARLDRSIRQLPMQPAHRARLHREIDKRQAATLRSALAVIGKAYRKKRRRFKGLKIVEPVEKPTPE